VRAVDVAAHDDLQAGTGRPARLFGELKPDAVERDGVVRSDDTPFFFTQDLLEIDVTERHERPGRVGGWPREGGVVVGDEMLSQVGVGGLEGPHARMAQFIDEPILERAIEALAAPAGLGE
jgi:hypothetical protein